MRVLIAGLATISVVWCLIVPQSAAAEECQVYYYQARDAARATPANLDRLQQLSIQVRNSQQCSETQKICFAYLVSDLHAGRALDDENPPANAEGIAQAGFDIAPTWRSAWALASLAERRKDYVRAALMYLTATSELADIKARISARSQRGESFFCMGEGDSLPQRSQEDELKRRAFQTSALASSFVQLPPARCGGQVSLVKLGCGGTTRTPIPVEFRQRSTIFTDKGRLAARFLADFIKSGENTGREIILTGHTDDAGPDTYNCLLSKRRLDALIKFLRETGVSPSTTIVAIPQGRGEPFAAADLPSLPHSEVARINRRVELREFEENVQRKCPPVS